MNDAKKVVDKLLAEQDGVTFTDSDWKLIRDLTDQVGHHATCPAGDPDTPDAECHNRCHFHLLQRLMDIIEEESEGEIGIRLRSFSQLLRLKGIFRTVGHGRGCFAGRLGSHYVDYKCVCGYRERDALIDKAMQT